jgi:hypothetical protein
MAYTAKEVLHFWYWLVSHHWWSRAIGEKNRLTLLNMAQNMLFAHGWYFWSRQHTKVGFLSLQWNYHRLAVEHPIRHVDKWFKSQYLPPEWSVTMCDCPELPSDATCWCHCNCYTPCEWIELVNRYAQNELCPGEYKIAWSKIAWTWGIYGTVLHVNFPCQAEHLRVTYFRWAKKIESFDDVIHIPDQFVHVLWLFMAALISPIYGQMMQWQENNFMKAAQDQMEFLKKADNIAPLNITFDPNYPMVEQNVTSYPTR